MLMPQKKDQYALRAIYELAKRKDSGPTKISDIAEAQAIPVRFLEVILNQLKHSGLVASKRGFYGGYTLLKSPAEISVGEVLRFLQKDGVESHCAACGTVSVCPRGENCSLTQLWRKVREVVFKVYDETSMQDLLDYNEALQK
jgi:Rrf2 family protein